MRNEPEIRVRSVNYHRNGISGAGFYVVLFDEIDFSRSMLAIVFGEPGHVAVLDRNDVASGELSLRRGAAWRGDVFEPQLRAAIESHPSYRGGQ
jgi:hypothetical protein